VRVHGGSNGRLAAIPQTLSDAQAAPLLCAGITSKHSGAFPGDPVQGIGGPGTSEFNSLASLVIRSAIGRGLENAVLAKKLGASVSIDSEPRNAAEDLQKLGGAQVILATAPKF
jgi:D-arabinose 1-dehydrogenase-like Zn-dependent alcohol dehydrogenase